MTRRLILLLVVLGPAFAPAPAAETFDYLLRDLDGKLHRASDYRGQWLVINFWATWG